MSNVLRDENGHISYWYVAQEVRSKNFFSQGQNRKAPKNAARPRGSETAWVLNYSTWIQYVRPSYRDDARPRAGGGAATVGTVLCVRNMYAIRECMAMCAPEDAKVSRN
jgi:hypothetical protein